MFPSNCTFHRPATKFNPRPNSWVIDSAIGVLGTVLDLARTGPVRRRERYVPYFKGLPLPATATLNAAAEALIRAAGHAESVVDRRTMIEFRLDLTFDEADSVHLGDILIGLGERFNSGSLSWPVDDAGNLLAERVTGELQFGRWSAQLQAPGVS